MVVELRLSFSDVIGLLIVLLALICTVTAADTTTLLLPSIKSKSPITDSLRSKYDNIRGMSVSIVGGKNPEEPINYCQPRDLKPLVGSLACLKKYWQSHADKRANTWKTCRSGISFSHCLDRTERQQAQRRANVMVASRSVLHSVDRNPSTIWAHPVTDKPMVLKISLDNTYKVFGIEIAMESIPSSIEVSLQRLHQQETRTVALRKLHGCRPSEDLCKIMPSINIRNKVMTITWSNIDMDLLVADSIYLTLGGRQILTVVDYRTNFYTIRDITVLGTINRQVRIERPRVIQQRNAVSHNSVRPFNPANTPIVEPIEIAHDSVKPVGSIIQG